jgi:serine/threonine-protein kinase
MHPGQQVGPFTVEKVIGSGAMGSVYLARYKNGQRVALKFMSAGLGANPRALARFEREAEILKQLRHPNIVRLFGHGKHHRTPYYAMEYVEGETLEDVLARRGQLSWEEVVALGQQLCSALQHAHEQGIVHRDLKPSNLMLLRDGTLKLADFGIAKDLDVTQLTSANCTVGTAAYMSPEQCRGERNLSHKSDLYSLGIVFYELLTGRKPFDADNAMDMFLQHVQGTFERPSRVVMDIPIWLDTLVCQMLEKKPEQRPYDAAMVANALGQVAEKVAAQRSAGVDAVTGRAADRRPDAKRPDERDREAARALAAGLGKGKKKRKAKPLYKRAWLQALALVLALAGVGALLVVALKPPAPEELYAEAKRAWDSGDAEKREEAADPPSGAIHRYLARYGDRDDEMTRAVRGWADEVARDQRERSLGNRMRASITPDDERETAAQAALRHEEAGEFAQAVESWKGLLKYKAEPKRDVRVYGLLAEKRLRELAAVDERLAQLHRKADLVRAGAEPPPEAEPEAGAVEALRLEKLGDVGLAHRRWQAIKVRSEKDPERRAWFLLAARQAEELKGKVPDDDVKARVKLVEDRLEEATALGAAGKLPEAALLCREIVALYPENADVKGQVARAKDLFQKIAAAPQDR